MTEAMVSVEGKKLRSHTWVRIKQVEEGDWAIGGARLTSKDIKRIAA